MKNGEKADRKSAEENTTADQDVVADANASAGFRASASKFVQYADLAKGNATVADLAATQDRNA